MIKIAKWFLSLGAIALLVGFVWHFTPSASTSSKKAAVKTVHDSTEAPYRSPGSLHKVSMSDPEAIKNIEAQGAHAIADYGSFKLYNLTSEQLGKSSGKESTQIVDENNLVLLNSGTIDTSRSAAMGYRSNFIKMGVSAVKQMHLIQFDGPIQRE